MHDLVMSLVMIAALALLGGAWLLWRRTGQAKQPLLMVLLALIAFANIAIWAIPSADGIAPITQMRD